MFTKNGRQYGTREGSWKTWEVHNGFYGVHEQGLQGITWVIEAIEPDTLESAERLWKIREKISKRIRKQVGGKNPIHIRLRAELVRADKFRITEYDYNSWSFVVMA